MPKALTEFQNGVKRFDTRAKKNPSKETTELISMAKKKGDVEKACTAFDKAMSGTDTKALRAAYSDLGNALKAFKGKFLSANLKLQKGHEDAAGVATEMVTACMMVEQACLPDAKTRLDTLSNSAMATTTFYGDWSQAKKVFEGLTNKKKPAPTFLAAFRNSTGLETATKALDAASKANDKEKFAKALLAFRKTSQDYAAFVAKSAKVSVSKDDTDIPDESDSEFDYNQALTILIKRLNLIRTEAEGVLKDAG